LAVSSFESLLCLLWYEIMGEYYRFLSLLVLIRSASHLSDILLVHILRSYLNFLMLSNRFSMMNHSFLNSLVPSTTIVISEHILVKRKLEVSKAVVLMFL
jgi:hypothetical protein